MTKSAVLLNEANTKYPNKSLAVAYICAVVFFIGHRVYLGKYKTAILQLVLLPVFGIGLIWWIIDLFLIPSMVRELNDERTAQRSTHIKENS